MLKNNENKGWLGMMSAILGCLLLVNVGWAGTAWREQVNLTASDAADYDYFGFSVSIDADNVIVGAFRDDDNISGEDAGSAYIFSRDETGWLQQARLFASDGAQNDNFGYSVSISGDYAIVGAPDDDDNGTDSGSAYIFKWDGITWLEQAKLTASDGAAEIFFGESVSISGNYAIVGVRYDNDNGQAAGAAYIFKRDGTSWTQQIKLTASDAEADDSFGSSVAISSDYAIVGAYYDDDDVNSQASGSAYIFKRSDTSWLEQAKLTASDAAAGDRFGSSVSIDGYYAIVGAVLDDCHGLHNSGSAYIFKRDETSWIQQAKLVPSDRDVADEFGVSVSINGKFAVVGAHYDDGNAGQSGSAYVFERQETTWILKDKLTASDGEAFDYLAASVSISGNYVVLATAYDDNMGTNSGSVYMFEDVCPTADLSGDCSVDFEDYAMLVPHWSKTGCDQFALCNGADLDNNGKVDWSDLVVFAEQWLHHIE